MDALSTAIAVMWVLTCLAVFAIGAPMMAFARVATPTRTAPDPGAALVWTWLTLAILVPAAGAVRGFNVVTALLITAALPTAMWWHHHRGNCGTAFRHAVRTLVFRILEPRVAVSRQSLIRAAIGLALFALAVLLLTVKQIDVRLPVPADFDTFSRTRDLLAGANTWDPLASLAAVLARIAAADTLRVFVALRLALVVLMVGATGILLMEVFGRPAGITGAPLALMAAVPVVPLATQAIVVLLVIAATSLLRWFRRRERHEGLNVAAAVVLAACHLAPFNARPDVLWRVERTAHHLEHQAAASQALWFASQSVDDEWILIGPPEQGLEIDGRGRFYDLAVFVARFHDRASDPDFRFDFGDTRLFVLVEKHVVDVSRPAPGVRFVETQIPAYRVPQERRRLQETAMELCEGYRLNHAGAVIAYDDAQIRVYRFDV